jgi:hypothetical protein
MPGEPVGAVHVNALLSNLAVLYRPTEFMADDVAPYIDVAKESDLYPIFTQDDFYGTDVDDLVPDKSAVKMVEFSHTTAQYLCERRELGFDVSDRERKNADSQLRLERNKQVGTLGRLMLKREIRISTLLRKTTNGGGLTNGANAAASWSTAGTTSIESDIRTARETIRKAIGIRPNVLIIPEAVASGMQTNTTLNNKLIYTYGDAANRPQLSDEFPLLPAVLFGMQVRVPGLIQNTAHEGAAGSYSDVWGKAARVLYITGGPALETPSVAYTFRSEPLTTRQWRDDEKRKDNFAVGQTIAEKVVAPLAGYEIGACIP